MAAAGHQALIFGASGITGWALARQALVYPTPAAFARVVALTNRPLDRAAALLPDDARLALHSGVDLTQDAESVKAALGGIEGIEHTTHVYFAGECWWLVGAGREG